MTTIPHIANAQMAHTTPSGLLQVWFYKESDATNFLHSHPVEKRSTVYPIRLNKWTDSTFRVDILL